jgi:hypothetical protein
MTHHVQCDSVMASLRAVHNLTVVAGFLFLSMYVAVWISDMVLNFCVCLREGELLVV